MKKKIITLCTLLLAALLTTGCSNSFENETSLSNGIPMKGICGEDITVVDYLEERSEYMDTTQFSFSVYTYEGFGYYSPSDGKVGVKSNTFNAVPFVNCSSPNYRHIDVGDKIGSLELKSANGMLFDTESEISLEQQTLCFSGKITLKGYIHLCIGDEMYCEEDDLLFYPSNETWKDLPFNSYNSNSGYLGENYDFYWCGNAPVIHLGKVSDRYYDEISKVSKEPKEVTVTLSDIVLNCCFTDMFFGAGSYINTATLDTIIF